MKYKIKLFITTAPEEDVMAQELDYRQQQVVNDIVAGKLCTLRACRCSKCRQVLEAAYKQARHDPKLSVLAQQLCDQIAELWPEPVPLSA